MLPLTLEGGLLAMMAEVKAEAEAAVASIPGATVEDNKYSVSVHFRNCHLDDWSKVRLTLLRDSPHRLCFPLNVNMNVHRIHQRRMLLSQWMLILCCSTQTPGVVHEGECQAEVNY